MKTLAKGEAPGKEPIIISRWLSTARSNCTQALASLSKMTSMA